MVKDRFGNKVWLRGIIALSKSDETGDIMALIVVRDVTERKKIEVENTRRMDLIMGLTNDYESVYFVDLETDSYDIYRRNDRITTKYSSIFLPSYSDSIKAFAYRGVYRQDRENFIRLLSIEEIRKTLGKKNGFTFSFRTGNTGAPQYYQVKGVRIGSGRNMESGSAAAGTCSCFWVLPILRRRDRKNSERENFLKTLSSRQDTRRTPRALSFPICPTTSGLP